MQLQDNKIQVEERSHAMFCTYKYWRDPDTRKKKLLSLYELKENGDRGFEVYSGPNYVVGTTVTNSYSRNYSIDEIPKKYTEVAERLEQILDDSF